MRRPQKCCEISTLLLSTLHTDKSKVEILQNFVIFSEYSNFMVVCCTSFTYLSILGLILCLEVWCLLPMDIGCNSFGHLSAETCRMGKERNRFLIDRCQVDRSLWQSKKTLIFIWRTMLKECQLGFEVLLYIGQILYIPYFLK